MSQSFSLDLLLLKTTDRSGGSDEAPAKDRYVEFLEQQNSSFIDKITHLNLLEFQFVKEDQLRSKLIDILFNSQTKYKALILTSRQTVESFHNATFSKEAFDSFKAYQNCQARQNVTIVYCVGEQTAKAFNVYVDKLREANLPVDHNSFLIKTTTTTSGQEETAKRHKQNSSELAKLIIDDFKPSGESLIFYPCSSIRKDDLSNQLREHSIQFDELFVYDTGKSEKGVEQFKATLQANLKQDKSICLVFFSPSGVEIAFEAIQSLFDECLSTKLSVISVGPSTSAKLKHYLNQLNLSLIEMAEPSPKALFDSLNLIKLNK